MFWCASNTHWKDGRFILIGDGQGYYSYLPAIFIYHDLNFGFYDSIGTKYFGATKYDYRSSYKGKTINKYFCGPSMAMLPFFGVAQLITLASPQPADGFSKYYTIFVQIACITWQIIGLIYLQKLLRLYTKTENLISFALIAIVFGTNIFYYNISEPGMSHIYSFTFITMFTYYAKQFITHQKNSYILYCLTLLGMIILLRPINILILFAIPFLSDSPVALSKNFNELVKRRCFYFSGIILLLLIVSIQLALYKASAGSFWIDSYSVESFDFSKINVINFLFSYKKGMFIYTPLLLVSLLGFVHLWKKNRFVFFSFAGFIALLIYILSSWWQWFYGGSFSCRVMIEYYAFFAILLVNALQLLEKSIFKNIFFGLICALILICQIQTLQYKYNYIHWSEMNKERYWNVFLRVDLLLKHQNPNADLLTIPK
jgi:hypothetical protein